MTTTEDMETVWHATVDTGRPVDPVEPGAPAAARPVMPAAWRHPAAAARALARHALHAAAYHTIRTPKYAAKVALWAPVGLARVLWRVGRWVADADGRPVRDVEGWRANPDGWRRLGELHDQHVRRRLAGAAVALLLATVAVAALLLLAPTWVQWTTAATAVVALARVGRPADRPITDHVTVGVRHRKLTAAQVRTALTALGIAAMKAPDSVTFPREIHRDGPGYLATVDLPAGITATEVIDRRTKLASALRVPVDQCWPEPVPGQHAGRLALWVADDPVSMMRQPAWPLVRAGTVDVFSTFPFGTTPRRAEVRAGLIWRNWLIGAMPGAGKTGALRLLLAAAALDRRVELRGYELKGSGDLDPFAPVCVEYGSGPDDDTVTAALDMLRWARRECSRRAEQVKRYAAVGKAPEHKITPELAGLGLPPVVLFVDEAQELFAHERHGQEAGQLATQVIKLGRALGVILLLATQRPDKDSLPTGVSANVNTRFCLRVMGQVENDLVLGTSAYRNGIRATQWTDRDLGWGWLVGVGDPVAVHVHHLTPDHTRTVVDRAVKLRGGPVEPVQRTTGPRYDLLADLAAVWPDDQTGVWSEVLAQRLTQLRPDHYTGWDTSTLNAALRARGVHPTPLHRKIDGKGITRHGIRRDAIDSAPASGTTSR